MNTKRVHLITHFGLQYLFFLLYYYKKIYLLTSNYFSIFYNNREVWHLQNLKSELKQNHLSA